MEWVLSMLNSAIRLTTPIAYVTLGAVFMEKSGINALAMEGIMLMGAFGAVLGSWLFASAWAGVAMAVALASACALLRSWLCITHQGNQTVSGIGLNVLTSGATAMLLKVIWGMNGKSDVVDALGDWTIWGVAQIPILGDLFGSQNPLVYLLLLLIPVCWIIMNKTALGLRITVAGEKPEVLSSLGLRVSHYRYYATLLAGVLTGLGGAYLSIGQLSFFSNDMTSGRGYMALAACVFGRWSILGGIAGALLFGVADSIQMRMQSATQYTQFVQMIPYLVTLAVLCCKIGNKRTAAPAASGKPYREQQ